MEAHKLKEYISLHDAIPSILEQIGCHHIKDRDEYYQCGNPDGDNTTAITVYKDNLLTINYTRNINPHKKRNTDIFDLVMFFEQCNFFQAVNKICKWLGIDYYYDTDQELPESLQITQFLLDMLHGDAGEEKIDKPVKPISERILTYYLPFVNDMFARDNIDYGVQQKFEIGYDDYSNRITIPIRDEIGTLVGVKGRLFQEHIGENELKYIYLEPCNRSAILYGLYLSIPFIEKKKQVFVTESEKGVMQLWNMGYKNSVGIGGKQVSRQQINKLTRLCADIIFLFDKDVQQEEIEQIASRFVDSVKVYAVIDKEGILDEKESPTDNPKKFKRLIDTAIIQVKRSDDW